MPTPDWSVQKFARRLMRLERDFKTLSTVPRLGNSSVDEGAILIKDPVTKTTNVVLGTQDDGSVMVNHVAGPPPPIPAAPVVTTDTPGYLTVEWDGGFVGKNLLPETADIADLGVPYGGSANPDLSESTPSLQPSYKITTVGSEAGPGFSWLVHGESLDPLETYTFSAKFKIPMTGGMDSATLELRTPGGTLISDGADAVPGGGWQVISASITTDATPDDVVMVVRGVGGAGTYYNVGDFQVERGPSVTSYERPGLAMVPSDFSRVEVHASPDSRFLPDPTLTLKTTIESPRGGKVAIAVPYDAEQFVRLVARSLSGKASAPSVEGAGTSRQIQAFDVADAALVVTKFQTNQHIIF